MARTREIRDDNGNLLSIQDSEGNTVWQTGDWGTRGYDGGIPQVRRDGQNWVRAGSASGWGQGGTLEGKLFQGRPFSDYTMNDPTEGFLIREDALKDAKQYNKSDIGNFLPAALMALGSMGTGLHAAAVGQPGLLGSLSQQFSPAQSSVMGWENTIPGTAVDTVAGGGGGALPTSMEASGLAGGQFTAPGYGPTITGGNMFGAGGLGGGALPSIMDAFPGGGVTGGGSALSGLLGQAGSSAAGGAASRLVPNDASNSPAGTVSQYLKELGIDISPGALGLIGTGLSTGLGVLGANQQDKALQSVVDSQKAVTQPFVTDALDMLNNPDKFYQRPEVTGAIDASLRGLSAKVGNPINNPGAIAQQAAYNTGLYNQALNSRLATALGGQDTLNRLQTNQALQSGNQLNAIGSGLGSMLSTAPNINNLLAQYLLGKA